MAAVGLSARDIKNVSKDSAHWGANRVKNAKRFGLALRS